MAKFVASLSLPKTARLINVAVNRRIILNENISNILILRKNSLPPEKDEHSSFINMYIPAMRHHNPNIPIIIRKSGKPQIVVKFKNNIKEKLNVTNYTEKLILEEFLIKYAKEYDISGRFSSNPNEIYPQASEENLKVELQKHNITKDT